MDYLLFLSILSLGVAIPFSLIVFITLYVKFTQGDNFSTNMRTLAHIYLMALLGWAIFISIMFGGV